MASAAGPNNPSRHPMSGALKLLKSFLRRRRRPVILILDSHPAQIAKMVAAFVQSQRGRLELHFLPGYAPDLNPDEFVWKHLKSHGLAKKPLERGESLRLRVVRDLEAIRRNVRLVRSFFQTHTVAYVMDEVIHRATPGNVGWFPGGTSAEREDVSGIAHHPRLSADTPSS